MLLRVACAASIIALLSLPVVQHAIYLCLDSRFNFWLFFNH